MNKLTFVFIAAFIKSAHAEQIVTQSNEKLWIATVDDDVDCDKVTYTINNLINGHRRRLGVDGSDGVLEELYGGYDCFVSFSTPDDSIIEEVKEIDGVVSVDMDEVITGFEEWNLDRADQDNLPLDKEKYLPGYTGRGQCLFVIDTGIYKEHREFGDRAYYGADYVNENPKSDANTHGSHVSGTAAGYTYGIAPETPYIFGVKVLNKSGGGSTSAVIKGIQWSVTHANDVMKQTCVLSLSLGGGKNSALDKAASDAAKKHFVIVAAGNSNADACNYSPAGAGGNVITVGSTDKNDVRSTFSNYGKCVDIFAPGTNIKSVGINGPSDSKTLSGTSMATPYIAGLALQFLEKNKNNYNKARQELFATALGGKVKNPGKGSKNLLGRISDYVGPPTPPTVKPTMPPSHSPPLLCKTGTNKCFEFAGSQFSPNPWYDSVIVGPVVFPSDVDLCSSTKENFNGKIVMVRRGDCLFMEKVKNAENRGAAAVLIYNDANSRIFSPAYYGNAKTNLPSCMVPKSTAGALKNGDLVSWGPKSAYGDDTGSPTSKPTKFKPTKRPTNPPTPRPTRPTKAPTSPTPAPTNIRCDHDDQETCAKRHKCRWDGYVCYVRPKYQKKN